MSIYSVPEQLLDEEYSSSLDSKYFYETSNMRDYKGTFGKPAPSARPPTSNFYTKTKTEKTKYEDEFSWKKIEKNEIDRPGTASGQRKNNPHPSEDFIAWKFSKNGQKLNENELQQELLDELCRDKIRSTYQVDYQNEEGGTTLKKTIKIQRPIHEPPHTLDTTVRVDYQSPRMQEKSLKCETNRYGCNNNKKIPALGAVPESFVKANLKYCKATSYGEEFTTTNKTNKMADTLPEEQERISKWEGPSW